MPLPQRAIVLLCAAEEVRDLLTYWLKDIGIDLIIAADGHAADKAVRQSSCRVLITDRVLPPWPGLDTIRTLRRSNPALTVAFVDNGSRDSWAIARLSGADVLLSRPLERRAVMTALDLPESMARGAQ